jgi:large subunit ribosomal protein L23
MKKILIRPLTTEKAIKMIEIENKITFVVYRKAKKAEIAEAITQHFKSKVDKVNVQIRNNKKIAFIKLKPETPAIDIATKLGII